jgi:tetratricopeptide (TPR) repeat protein
MARLQRLLIEILAEWHGVSQKQIASRLGISEPSLSRHLWKDELTAQDMERLLAAIPHQPAEEAIVTRMLEALDALDDSDLSGEELAIIEEAVLGAGRIVREVLTECALRFRIPLTTEKRCEQIVWLCEESERLASRDVHAAEAVARIAAESAEEVEPECLRDRARSYSGAFRSSVRRVAGELKAADVAFVEVERRWEAGRDPGGFFDYGRILDLKASLRRDQRRFGEAMALLEEAIAVGRRPELAWIKKGFTYEVMGEYRNALDAYLQAAPLVESKGDRRLENILRYDLALVESHLGFYAEAAERVAEAWQGAEEMGDKIALTRMTWLSGRIAAGLGSIDEALKCLSTARSEFAGRGMSFDVALAALEEAALLLDVGRTDEVKALAQELVEAFESKGVHREALAALRLFQEAAEQEAASAKLARRLLRFFFRAQHDKGLHFNNS